jgi:hypothetical protein
MFYQSMLCPEYSAFQTKNTDGVIVGRDGYVNNRCKCVGGYYPDGGACVKCPTNSGYIGSTDADTEDPDAQNIVGNGYCKCNDGYKKDGAKCVEDSNESETQ